MSKDLNERDQWNVTATIYVEGPNGMSTNVVVNRNFPAHFFWDHNYKGCVWGCINDAVLGLFRGEPEKDIPYLSESHTRGN